MAPRFSAIFLIALLGYVGPLHSEDFKRTVITDPSISRRCDLLSENRKTKISHNQRIMAMIERNKHLLPAGYSSHGDDPKVILIPELGAITAASNVV
jgi:hypothetical protein